MALYLEGIEVEGNGSVTGTTSCEGFLAYAGNEYCKKSIKEARKRVSERGIKIGSIVTGTDDNGEPLKEFVVDEVVMGRYGYDKIRGIIYIGHEPQTEEYKIQAFQCLKD